MTWADYVRCSERERQVKGGRRSVIGMGIQGAVSTWMECERISGVRGGVGGGEGEHVRARNDRK